MSSGNTVAGAMAFEFRDFKDLTEGVVDLLVEKTEPADPSRGHVPCYHFRILLHQTSEPIGKIRLRVGHVPVLLIVGHVGFDIDEPHRGHGYAARACVLVRQAALVHGLDKLVIAYDPDNVASRKTCEQIGATFVGIADVPEDHELYRQGERTVARYDWNLGVTVGKARESSRIGVPTSALGPLL